MKFRPFRHATRLLSAAGLFFLHAVASAADRVEEFIKLLPEGACIIISIKDTPELVKDWDASGIGRFMEDEAVKKWMAPMYKDGMPAWDKEMVKISGMTFREALSIYPGTSIAAFVVDDLEDFKEEEPRLVSISELKGQEAAIEAAKEKQLEAFRKDEHPDAVVKTEELGGITVKYFAESEDEDAEWIEGWAVVNDILLEVGERELMEKTIARVKGGEAAHPAGARVARLAELRGAVPDIMVYGDLETLIRKLEDKLKEEAAKSAGSPFTPEQLFDALGARELRGLAACVDLNDAQSRAELVVLHDEQPQNIFTAFLRGVGGDVPQPSFMPAGADAASVTRASLANMYDTLMKAVNKLGPMAAMVTSQISAMEQQAGMSIRNDLLGSLDDLYVDVNTMGREQNGLALEQNQVAGFKLKNKERFQAAFDSFWNLMGKGFGVFEESEYEGYTIRMMKSSLTAATQPGGVQTPRIGYVITDEYVFMVQGEPDLLHKVLGRLKGTASGPSLWEDPKVQQALAALPAGYSGMGVSNGSSILRAVIGAVSNAGSVVPGAVTSRAAKGPKSRPGSSDNTEDEDEDSSDGAWVDPKAMPSKEVFERYFGMGASGVYSHPDATQILYISLPVEK